MLAALRAPTLPAERREKFEILRARAERVREVVFRDKYKGDWDVYPFNAGYFMCIRVKGVAAEKLRLHLLEKYGVGRDRDGPERHPRRFLVPRARPDRAAVRDHVPGDRGPALGV